jgi:hypothetical protein
MLGLVLHLIKIMPVSDGMYYSIAPLAIMGIAAGVQALAGIIQTSTASGKGPEPQYEIPEETKRALREAEARRTQGMPEPSRMMALQGAQQSALFGMRAAQDRRAGLAAIGNIQSQLDRSALSIAAQDAVIRRQNQIDYENRLLQMGQEQKLKFQTEYQSWQNAEQQAREQQLAGQRNIVNAIQTGLMGASMYGGGGGTSTGFETQPLQPISTGFERQQNALSGMSSVVGTGRMPSMPGTQPMTTPAFPYYGSPENTQSRQIFNSLIRR